MQRYFQTELVKKEKVGDGYVQVPLMTPAEIGHLVPMRCGHRGKPSRNEERMLDNLIRESGFLDHYESASEEIHRSNDKEDSMLLRPEVQQLLLIAENSVYSE